MTTVEEAKIGEKQSRQSNSKYNFMQYEKGMRTAQWGLGQSPRSWKIFENLCVESILTVCKVTFNCKLQKKNWESRMYWLLPNNFVGGALPLFPRFPRLCPTTMTSVSVIRNTLYVCPSLFSQESDHSINPLRIKGLHTLEYKIYTNEKIRIS